MTATIENDPQFEYTCGLAMFEDDQYVVSFPGHDENSSFRIPYEKTLRFGKYRDRTIKDVYVTDIDYAWWLANLPWFRENHKRLVRAVSLGRKRPTFPPSPQQSHYRRRARREKSPSSQADVG